MTRVRLGQSDLAPTPQIPPPYQGGVLSKRVSGFQTLWVKWVSGFIRPLQTLNVKKIALLAKGYIELIDFAAGYRTDGPFRQPLYPGRSSAPLHLVDGPHEYPL